MPPKQGTPTGATYPTGDLNGDGRVNFSDALILIQHYGQGPAAAQLDFANVLAQAPEPANLVLLGAACGLLLRRSRQR